MNNFFNQLNMTPQERRIVVIVFLVVIVVLNLLFVWPHFGEWGSINAKLEAMRKSIASDYRMIALDTNPTNGLQVQIKQLSRLEGSTVMEHPVDPAIQLANTIQSQEAKTGVNISSFGKATPKPGEFFDEISTSIEVQGLEPQLINFLYNMGQDPAMIRVSRLDLQPDDRNTRYKLKGNITLTANYAKRPPVTANTNSAAKPFVVVQPAAPSAGKPGPAARKGPPAPAQAGKPAPPGAGPQLPGRPSRQGGKPFMPNGAKPMPLPNHAPGQSAQPPS